MSTSIGMKRLRRGIAALAVLFMIGLAGYRLAGWSFVESCYMVALILSTVGLESVHPLSPGLMVFTTLMTVFGVFTVLYIMGVFVQMTTEGELNRVLGMRRVSREINRLSGHVILCGFGRMGEILAGQLLRQKRPFVVIEKDPERIAEAVRLGYLAINDDSTEEDTLLQAGVRQAAIVVTTLPSRNLNPSLQIIARGEFPSTEKKLEQAGADRVVLPAAAGALRMAAMITRPTMVELVELAAGRHTAEVEVDELMLSEGSPLVGKTIGESHIRARNGLLIVAVRRPDETLLFAPQADMEFRSGDKVIVIGPPTNIERFRQEYSL